MWENTVPDVAELPITHFCSECGWQAEGPVSLTHPLFVEHRRVAHGKLPQRRLRKKVGSDAPVFVSGASLEENLAKARAAGSRVVAR